MSAGPPQSSSARTAREKRSCSRARASAPRRPRAAPRSRRSAVVDTQWRIASSCMRARGRAGGQHAAGTAGLVQRGRAHGAPAQAQQAGDGLQLPGGSRRTCTMACGLSRRPPGVSASMGMINNRAALRAHTQRGRQVEGGRLHRGARATPACMGARWVGERLRPQQVRPSCSFSAHPVDLYHAPALTLTKLEVAIDASCTLGNPFKLSTAMGACAQHGQHGHTGKKPGTQLSAPPDLSDVKGQERAGRHVQQRQLHQSSPCTNLCGQCQPLGGVA